MNSARMRLEWMHRFGPHLDATVWAAAGRSFDDTIELSAAVPAVGSMAPTDITSVTWSGGASGVLMTAL